ncbi:MAG: transposase [Actinomycetota bacterium]
MKQCLVVDNLVNVAGEQLGKILFLVSIREIKKVLTFPISSRAKDSMIPLITRYTKAGSLYYTDDWFAYKFLPIRGNYVVVMKEKGLPKGRDHLNSIEGFWSYAKHWLYQYRGV